MKLGGKATSVMAIWHIYNITCTCCIYMVHIQEILLSWLYTYQSTCVYMSHYVYRHIDKVGNVLAVI